MNTTNNEEEQKLDAEMAIFWSLIEDNLPKTQEMEALGKDKIFYAVKPAYIQMRSYMIRSERSSVRRETVEACKQLIKNQQVYNVNDDVELPYISKTRLLTNLDTISHDTN